MSSRVGWWVRAAAMAVARVVTAGGAARSTPGRVRAWCGRWRRRASRRGGSWCIPVGQDVEQEAADELVRGQRAGGGILGAEGDGVVSHRNQAGVGDPGAAGVAAEVLDEFGRAGKGRRDVDVPVHLVEPLAQGAEARGVESRVGGEGAVRVRLRASETRSPEP